MYYLGAIMSRRSMAYLLHVVKCSLNSEPKRPQKQPYESSITG